MNRYHLNMAGASSYSIEATEYYISNECFYFFVRSNNDSARNVVAIFPVNRTAILSIEYNVNPGTQL